MMTNNNKDINNIPAEKFQFAQENVKLYDKKLQTKPRGYFKDAWIRFKKNKSSVIATVIIAFLLLFSIVAPLISPYKLADKDSVYINMVPYVESMKWLFTGTKEETINETQYEMYQLMEQETGEKVIEKIISSYTETEKFGFTEKVKTFYVVRINQYTKIGIKRLQFTEEEFLKLQDYQAEIGRQIIYPAVNERIIGESYTLQEGANYWYEVDNKGVAVKDSEGNVTKAYLTKAAGSDSDKYYGQKIEGDDGTYAYAIKTGTGAGGKFDYRVRVLYSEYYIYKNGHAPSYVFGTNTYGQDIFNAIGIGARFSLILAIFVSAINMFIGTIYGAIEGYYGGAVDMVMERISDIISGIPSIVAMSLFQLYLARKIGSVGSLLVAFVITGWIGMAALVRKQFYRFKGQEYVLVAKSLGANDRRIMFKHIFPNSLGTIITSCVLVIPGVISSETMLTYLGIVNLSGNPDLTSIGVLMTDAQPTMERAPHALFYPALFVSLLLITFNLFGNGLRDAFNPSLRGSED